LIQSFWRKCVFEKELNARLFSRKLKEPFKVKKIAILVDASIGIGSEFFLRLSKDFNIPEFQISLFLFGNGLMLESQYNQILKKKEVNYWSVFKGELLDFCKGDYDLIINYYNTTNILFSLVSIRTDHKLSVGFRGADHRVNDVVFDIDPTDKITFKKELIMYMKILNKI
tara:strand:+ start:5314 stop:5823 length:510 start_codon:yes stop_codon:yes gene_type:complete